MELTKQSLRQKSAWVSAGVAVPDFDTEQMVRRTREAPVWVHFGSGNIFRGFPARLQQNLLNRGLTDRGIIAAETYDGDIIRRIYRPHDDLSLFVTLLPDGNVLTEAVASVAESIDISAGDPAERARLTEVFRNPSLQLATFTITEKGYSLTGPGGIPLKTAEADFADGPGQARHAMGIAAELLFARYQAGGFPVAVVSLDNCSRNGEKLRNSVLAVAREWKRNGFVGNGFLSYLSDSSRVSFPWSMIDKITPRPSGAVEKQLAAMGIEGMAPIVTAKGTYIAPFVNAEAPQYLVVEDSFPNGRPPLEKAGVFLTDRQTVNDAERMKVCTCLNPLHTALAVFGCLLGFKSIAAEMQDENLRCLARCIGLTEGMAVCTDPGIINPADFLHEVLEKRLPNPFLPDTPQRIACDTSQKIPIRFGETIKAYLASDHLKAESLTFIPLAIAGWLRYLLAVDDTGSPMEVSSDPMLPELQQMLSGARFGEPDSAAGKLSPILSRSELFGVDLCRAGLSEKIERMFREMLTGPGAVRTILQKYCGAPKG